MSEHTIVAGTCESCGAALTLECEPLQGFWNHYNSFNEFLCPRCGKRNVVRSSGAVLRVRVRESEVSA